MRFSVFFKTWALGLTAYALVFTREVPTALAQVPIETDCSTNLDQPDTTYLLNTNVSGNCVIAAQNIILDGQNLYEIDGNIQNSAAFNFSVHNIPLVDGNISSYYGSSDYGGNISIQNSIVSGYAGAFKGHLEVIDSTIDVYARGDSGISLDGVTINGGRLTSYDGDIEISDSTVAGSILFGYAYDQVYSDHFITITSSTFEGYITSDPRSIIDVSILDSTIGMYVHASGDVVVTDSVIQEEVFSNGYISIADSTIEGAIGANTTVSIIDSEISDQVLGRGVTVVGSLLGGSVGSLAGDLSVTDSTVAGQPHVVSQLPVGNGYNTGYDYEIALSANSGNITVRNSNIDGFVQTFSVGKTIDIELSVVYGDVVTHRADIPDGTVIMTNSSVIEGEVFAESLVLVDTVPSLTAYPLNLSLDYGEDFNPFSGVSADDIKDGDLSSEVVVIGEVGQTEGVYELLYSVTDGGTSVDWNGVATTSGPSTATTTRTVTRGEKPTQSTSIGVHKDRKEKEAAQEEALPDDTTALIETLRTTLNEPGAINDPEALKQLIDLVRQLIVALFELMAAQGKLK